MTKKTIKIIQIEQNIKKIPQEFWEFLNKNKVNILFFHKKEEKENI